MPAPTRRFLAALVLALLAVVVPVTAGGTALAGPAFPGPSLPAEPGWTSVTDLAAASDAATVPGTAGASAPAILVATSPVAPDPVAAGQIVAGSTGSDPATATVPDPEPVAAGPHAVPGGRAAVLVRASDSPGLDTPAPPGAVLDALIPALPAPSTRRPDVGADVPGSTGGLEPGHGVPADPRGPPAV